MNDIILTCLLNLFALFASGRKRENSEKILSEYLVQHFGLKDVQSALEFYHSMLDFYESQPDLDKASLCSDLSSKLKSQITTKERILVVLRFMEVRSTNGEGDMEDFYTVANQFEISDEVYQGLVAFVTGAGESNLVKTIQYGEGYIRTLFLQEYDSILFAYHGNEAVKYNGNPILSGSFLTWQRSGVIKLRGQQPLYYFNAQEGYGIRHKDKVQLKLRGNGIEFRYGNGPMGIHNFTFNLYEGELVAIMGGSGTGKSTLQFLLNGSLTPQSGQITINGHKLTEPEAKALIGNVPQDDLLIENLTVYQNLYYTARLCFDGVSEEVIKGKVFDMLHDLGLEAAKDLKVGSPVEKIISGGQRKRLNIALELIREPNILFLDEPTSGLSSADSLAVMDLLREQVYKGKLIVVNIHQPSSDIFKMFDRLWILDVGGYPIYDGNPIEAVTYFKHAARYADDQTSVCPKCGNIDSEIILSIVNEKVVDNNGEVTDKRKKTPQEWHELYLKTAAKSKYKLEDLPKTEQKRPSTLKQMWIFFIRNIKTKLADKQWLLISLLEAPVLALICALLTHYAPDTGYTLMENKNFVSYMFMAVIVVTFLGMSGSAEEIIKDRALLKREKFLGLSYQSYIWSKIIFMAIVALVQTFLFVVIGNAVIELHCLFGKWLLILFATEMLAALMGLLLSQWFKSVVAIYITIPLLLIPQILLCGLVVKFPDLTPNSPTANVPIVGDVIPSRWSFEALAITTFTENDYEKVFFDSDKIKYEARYYEVAYLHELTSQLETMEDRNKKGENSSENLETIKKSLPRLLNAAGMEPYKGEYTYEALNDLFDEAGKILSRKSNIAGKANERIIEAMVDSMGQEEIVLLKQRNFNLQLERQLVNSEAEEMFKIANGYIVPQAGYVYVDPLTHDGRAPFFSSCKIVGDAKIKTTWYNLMIMLLMSVICTVFLLTDFPGRYVRKK